MRASRRTLGVLASFAVLLLVGIVFSLARSSSSSSRAHVELREPAPAPPSGGAATSTPQPPATPTTVATVRPPRTILRGTVTIEETPAVDATVTCDVPYAALEPSLAKAGAHGNFSLDVVPQPSYRLVATSGYALARVNISHAAAMAGPIHIELHQLLYEKVSFVTTDGTPVAVAGRQECAVFAHAPEYESFFNVASYDVSWLPPEIPLAALADNELMYITTKPSRGGPGGRIIDFQGYKPVEVPVQLLPLQEWPAGREIVLSPDPDEAPAVPHRVVFPDITLPAEWMANSRMTDLPTGMTVAVAILGDSSRTYWVNPEHPVLRIPRAAAEKAALKVLYERTDRRVALRDGADGVEMLVDWPRYAFLDLRFPASYPGKPQATPSLGLWSSETFAIGGRLVEPGHARFVVPEGAYVVQVEWWDDASPFMSWRLRTPAHLGAGLNELEVHEDDMLPKASR